MLIGRVGERNRKGGEMRPHFGKFCVLSFVIVGLVTQHGCTPEGKVEEVSRGVEEPSRGIEETPAASGEAKRYDPVSIECGKNLRDLLLALKLYANDHENDLPAALSDLYPEYFGKLSILLCPDKNDQGGRTISEEEIDTAADYEYVPGLTMKVGSDAFAKNAIVIREKPGHHDQPGFHIVRLHGTVEWMPGD